MDVLVEWSQKALAEYGRNILTGMATLVIGWLLARLVRLAIRRGLGTARVDATVSAFCVSLAYVAMLTVVVITALHHFGVPTVSFAAIVGAAGLAVGLALKGTLSNLAAGVVLVLLRPFSVGDRITAAGITGVVTKVQIFATTLEDEQKNTVIVPNASLTGAHITNHAGSRA